MDHNGSRVRRGDQLVAVGEGSVVVDGEGMSDIVIELAPATAGGMIDFSVIWNPELVLTPTTEVFLTSGAGEQISLNATEIAGEANFNQNGIPSGFYTLQVFLKDQGIYVMGAVETVEIKDGIQSSLNFDFSEINKVGQAVTVNNDSFTVAWENDAEASTIDEFRIYTREHGSQGWTLLDTIPGTEPLEFTVTTAILTKGNWDFAVSTLSDTTESELHTSMDDTAIPTTGWYVEWI